MKILNSYTAFIFRLFNFPVSEKVKMSTNLQNNLDTKHSFGKDLFFIACHAR